MGLDTWVPTLAISGDLEIDMCVNLIEDRYSMAIVKLIFQHEVIHHLIITVNKDPARMQTVDQIK